MKSKKKVAEEPFAQNRVPNQPGLYWVKMPNDGHYIAHVHGVSPFLKIELCDPTVDAPRLKPSTKEIAQLTWCGEITRPAGGPR